MQISKSKLIKFTAFSVAAMLVLITALVMMSADNVLLKAAANADTVTIDAEYQSTAHTLTVQQSVSYKNRSSDMLSEVKFHIYANAYAKGVKYSPVSLADIEGAYPSGEKSYGGIEILQVTAAKQTAEFVIEGEDDTVLSVPLAKSLKPAATIQIDISYVVELANIKHRLGWTERAVNLANFYPIPVKYEHSSWQVYPYSYNGDPFYNDMHNYDVRLTCDKDFVVASSGTLIRENTAASKKTVQYKSKAIRDFALVLSKHFESKTAFVKKVAVSYYYFDDSNPEESLETACDSLTTFSRMFTKYPYKQLAVVQTDFLHGGMEYGELVYISAAITERREYNNVIIHEIAHQWWYGQVGNNQNRTAWIDEGLAEYSTLLFYDENPKYKQNSEDLIQNAHVNYASFIRIANSVGATVNTQMNRGLNEFTNSYEYVFMTYVRGMLLFTNLETLFGRAKVVKGLKNFAHDHQFAFASQDRLISALEKSTSAKLQVYFASYLSGL